MLGVSYLTSAQCNCKLNLAYIFCDCGDLRKGELESSMWEVTGHKDNIGYISAWVRRDAGSTSCRRQVEGICGSLLRNCIINSLVQQKTKNHLKSLKSLKNFTLHSNKKLPWYNHE